MLETTAEVEAALSEERKWFHSWKLWLLTIIVVFLITAVCLPIYRFRRQSQIVRSLESEQVQFESSFFFPRKVSDAISAWNDASDWKLPNPTAPDGVVCQSHHVSRETFERLASLNLSVFYGDAIEFAEEDLEYFLARSSNLQFVFLWDSDELSQACLARIHRDHPELQLQAHGQAFPGVYLANEPGGVTFYIGKSDFSLFSGGELLTEMNGEPLMTYHQVKRAVEALKPGEQLRFTVKDHAGVVREEIYTAPAPVAGP